MNTLYIIGIDEAGRGSWAGPIVAGGWMVDTSIASSVLSSMIGLDDSKVVSEKKREELFLQIEAMQYRNECQFAFSYRDAPDVDRLGIREANRQCMQDVLLSLLQFISEEDSVEIYIDGRDNYIFDLGYSSILYDFVNPSKQNHQTEIIHNSKNIKIYYKVKGDSLYKQISAASIVAKVTRDRMMCDFDEDFPEYCFSSHKGYGTRKHREKMLHYGISPIHRKSYAPVKFLILEKS